MADAVTRSTTHLVQTNLRHDASRGCDRMFDTLTTFNSVTLPIVSRAHGEKTREGQYLNDAQ